MDLTRKNVIIVGSGQGKTTLARAIAEIHRHDLISTGKPNRGLRPFVTAEVPTIAAFASLFTAASGGSANVCVIYIQKGGNDSFAPTITHWRKQGILRDGVNLLRVVSPSVESDAMRALRRELGLARFFQKHQSFNI